MRKAGVLLCSDLVQRQFTEPVSPKEASSASNKFSVSQRCSNPISRNLNSWPRSPSRLLPSPWAVAGQACSTVHTCNGHERRLLPASILWSTVSQQQYVPSPALTHFKGRFQGSEGWSSQECLGIPPPLGHSVITAKCSRGFACSSPGMLAACFVTRYLAGHSRAELRSGDPQAIVWAFGPFHR